MWVKSISFNCSRIRRPCNSYSQISTIRGGSSNINITGITISHLQESTRQRRGDIIVEHTEDGSILFSCKQIELRDHDLADDGFCAGASYCGGRTGDEGIVKLWSSDSSESCPSIGLLGIAVVAGSLCKLRMANICIIPPRPWMKAQGLMHTDAIASLEA